MKQQVHIADKEGVYPYLVSQVAGNEVSIQLLTPSQLRNKTVIIQDHDYLIIDPDYLDVSIGRLCELIASLPCRSAVLCRDLRGHELEQLKASGLCSYINKCENYDQIREGITSFLASRSYFSNPIIEEQEEALSGREQSVIQLISHGLSTIEIADQLSLSVHTINSHRKNILKKLKARTTGDMIAKAIHLRLISCSSPRPS
ncbi:MAG: LuxR C-terminal-related transcriptional regulator [Cyclobacteriaceae bacterium]|nr:hypothetical protein [Cyclobacteriaceae bacterium]MCH8515900.1 LuxR C-terminal-related transcriptional regulator [Cyclobacteriaceae bacterium]